MILRQAVALALFLAAISVANLLAGDTTSAVGDNLMVNGDFNHWRAYDNLKVRDSGAIGDEPFREEIYGTNFSVSVLHLPAGKYTLQIGLTEVYFLSAGKRLFDITCGDTLIASNLDIFASVGGQARALFLTNVIDFAGDAIRGPLVVNFIGRTNAAKLNTFELRDEAGKSIVFLRAADVVSAEDAAARKIPVVPGPEVWKDTTQPVEARARDLVSRLSLKEKVEEMRNGAAAIPRLGIPAYDYWSECLHGVGYAGAATVFPQAIGMAATWDWPLVNQEADVIATEARAKHNDYIAKHDGRSKIFFGLTFWTPNINIFRDPRWGRGQETYGEDPFLTARLAVAFIRGLQGDDPNYVKAMACAKHYAVHSGPETARHGFNAEPPERDFYETYLPHFEAAVREGHVGAVMGAYNSVFGKPACASPLLLTKLLRQQWGFDGHVVSDCGAIYDIYNHHKFTTTPEEAAADAVKAGDDLCCGADYGTLVHAVSMGLISEAELDTAVERLMTARFRLGMFDPPEKVPYSQITIAQNDTPEHAELALKVARESIVLLKNNGLLPLSRAKLKRLAVIGPNADSVPVLLGNYHGTPTHPVTILNGIKQLADTNTIITYEPGCPLAQPKQGNIQPDESQWNKAMEAARAADAVIFVGGISADLEGEEMKVNYEGFSGGDRTQIELPAPQVELLKALHATGKPVVFVNCSGSAIAMPWAAEQLPAIVQAWYPGEQGGRAVAEVLFGEANPAGRLPITFYRSTEDLPAFTNYSMSNRTYRYFTGKPLYAFGHGLSYTKFNYSNARLDSDKLKPDGLLKVSFSLKNAGKCDGDEVAQVYFRHVHSSQPQANLALCGFVRIHLERGQDAKITVDVPASRFRYWDTAQQKYVVEPGDYEILVGAASDDIRARLPLKISP
jgi:beta-glucosidase